jgi:two-component SAPR family response regulator
VKRSTIVMLVSAAIAVAACGQSQEDKAKAQVCDARADVQKQVTELRGLTASTATVDGVTANLQTIRDDLGKITDAQSNLSDDRRQKVQAANTAFTGQVKSVVQNVGRSLSVADAKTQLKDATTQLASSYKQTLGQIDCG